MSALILVVDDIADNLQLVVDVLEGAGHQVITASDGPTTLKRAAAEQPNLIVLDVAMPGMSGLQVCARLKANAETAAIPILLLTALADNITRSEAKHLAEGYLTKPFTPIELRSGVARCLAGNY